MGLQFILGNAGGGKTWYIEHQAAAMASKDMKRQIFVVVPEQFTMQTQRNLVALSERHGLWNIEVQSFPPCFSCVWRDGCRNGTGYR